MNFAPLNHLKDLFQIFYPHICCACGNALSFQQSFVCTTCLHTLPFTNFWSSPANAMEQHLWGRFNFEQAVALFYFEKSSGVQNLLHELKYRNQKQLGIFLGEMLGARMKQHLSDSFDFIIPVPLHSEKEKIRGYNQSLLFAQGLANELKCEASKDFLIRTQATETQTHKNLFQRLDNVASVFELKNATLLQNKNVLLVDDVLTTGATIEACAKQLNSIQNLRMSVATIAVV
jgi:ComF family protein